MTSKPKGDKSSTPLRKKMSFNEGVKDEPADAGEDRIRILVPITRETQEYLRQEATRSATSVSALCSLAISDWVDNRRRERVEYLTMSKEEGYRRILQQFENVPPEVVAKVKELERAQEQRRQLKQP